MFIQPHLHLPRLPRILLRTLTTYPVKPLFSLSKATMPTGAPKQYDWICIMPDKADALERRLKIRAQHFENLKPLIESKFINFGGAFLSEPPEDGEQLAFKGSVFTCVAVSKEIVIEVLKKDPYTIGDVWDWEKAQIYPLKVAVRTALEN